MNMTRRFTLVFASMLLLLACNANLSPGPSQHGLKNETRLTFSHTQATPEHPNEAEEMAIKLYPLDEGPQDSSFVEFRNKLLMAAKVRNTAFIISITQPEIINGADIKRGVTEFKELWNPDEPNSRLWETLSPILMMGGSFRSNGNAREFCAPYVTSLWPSVVSQLPKNADPLDYQVIIEKNVEIRSAPKAIAPVVAVLSYDVVKVQSDSSLFDDSPSDGSSWLKISTLSGKEGYVLDKYTRSASDYQACFKKVRGKWLMTEFAARE